MAGKSNRGKNRKGTASNSNSTEQVVPSDALLNEGSSVIPEDGDTLTKSDGTKPEVKDKDDQERHTTKADVHLYPVSVKTMAGEKLELQLSPGDTVMDVRQFLLDAPETCYFTCYDLSLHTKDGAVHHLGDYNEIAEVADISSGGCFLEMIPALYDDRAIRAHVHRTRELISFSTLHSSSLSTVLALQHETRKNAPNNTGDAVKVEVPELENLGFMENVTDSLSNIFSSPSTEIRCVENLVHSSFNPPPSHRRLAGDLLYLDVVTLEGNKYCITGTTKAFYVNASTGNVLDPKPSKTTSETTTLVGLLQKISPKFKKAFREILERKGSVHPFENIQSMLPPNPWLGAYPIPDHKRDAARAEDSITLSFGSELFGMQRDWNEELQNCREFPRTTYQERMIRDRALYKVTSDFVDAATSGAIGVINRCIPSINPTDPECFHMYVHNNIFYSFAVDADLEKLPRKQALEENSKHEAASSWQNNSQNADTSNADSSPAVSPDTPTETQLVESEQATYASANNDLKGTKAFQEADVPGLYNLAMAIIDYKGLRLVAQSVLPGILQGDKSDSLLYGSVDNGKKICWNEDFHSKVLEAAKRLHLKEHSVLDGDGNVFKLAAPVESKGIVGSDDRHYLLDLMRVTPRDANYTGSGSRFCILRPELTAAFQKAESAKAAKVQSESELENVVGSDSLDNNDANKEEMAGEDKTSAATGADNNDANKEEMAGEDKTSAATGALVEDAGKDEEQTTQEANSHSKGGSTSNEIYFNPNVLTDFKLAGNQEDIDADEKIVQSASFYLNDVVLPKFIEDLCSLEVSPMDGQTLTDALHARGINVRYLGKIAEGTRHMPHLWDLCSTEIVVRSAKHIVKDMLRDTEDQDIGHAISHFFNCFLGKMQSNSAKGVTNGTPSKSHKKVHSVNASGKFSRGQSKSSNEGYKGKERFLYLNISSDSLWSDIQDFSKQKYQFDLPDDSRERVKKISVIRNFCQKVGVTISARKYDLDDAEPFQVSDILDIKPVVKHSIPFCAEAKDLVETGKLQLEEGMLGEAYTLFSEAFTILQQVTGPMHREVANCCRYLAMVLYHAGDMAGAIMQQHKELIINERCLGLDHPDTAHSYGNMALFYHGLNQTDLALRHMARALLLLGLSSGPDHPDVAATFINVAMMYQDVGRMNSALRYLQEALEKNVKLLGGDHIQTAVCYHALAIAFNYMGAFKLSHQHEKKTYDILLKRLGEEDARTKESQNWVNTFKMRELQMNAQKQKGLALNASSAQKAMDVLKANPDLIKAFQTAAGGSSSGNSIPPANRPSFGIGERGRGVDERAARAAAEVRKKAAARGLLIRPHGVPVQATPPLTQLLNNVINSSSQESAKEDNGDKNLNGEAKPPPAVEAPVGLGRGLGSLKSKGGNKGKAKA